MYESLQAMGIVTKDWVSTALRNNGGHLMAKLRPSQVADIVLSEQDDEKITIEVQNAHKVITAPWHDTLKLNYFKTARAPRGSWTQRSSATGEP